MGEKKNVSRKSFMEEDLAPFMRKTVYDTTIGSFL